MAEFIGVARQSLIALGRQPLPVLLKAVNELDELHLAKLHEQVALQAATSCLKTRREIGTYRRFVSFRCKGACEPLQISCKNPSVPVTL